MLPLLASSIASAGGQIGGAFLENMFGKDASKTAYKRQLKLLENQIPLMVKGAEKAGLHPLAAIGINPASGPAAAQIGDFSAMGANLGQIAQSFAGDAVSPQATQLAELAVRRAQLENDLLTSQIQNSNKALISQGRTPGVGSLMGIPQADGSVINITQKPGAQGDDLEKDMSDLGVVFAFNRFMQNMNEYLGKVPIHSGGPSLRDWWSGKNPIMSGPSSHDYYSGHMY